MGLWLTEGSKDITFNTAFTAGTKQIPKFSVVQTVNHIDIEIHYDKSPI